MEKGETNPLLDFYLHPKYDEIKPEHVVPGIEMLIEESKSRFAEMEEKCEKYDFDQLMGALEEVRDCLSKCFGVVGHLIKVKSSKELRDAHDEVLPKVIEWSNEVDRSKKVYEQMKRFRNDSSFEHWDDAKKRIVEKKLLDAKLSGIDLEGEKKTRFIELNKKLAELSTKFENNVIEAFGDFFLILRDPKDMEGIPQIVRILTAETAKKKLELESADVEKGPWAVTADFSTYSAFMKHCLNAEIRKRLFNYRITMASDVSIDANSNTKFDNSGIILEELKLRKEQALLLGFSTFAEMALKERMAGAVDAVYDLLEMLDSASLSARKRDHKELQEYAKEKSGNEKLNSWDIAFWEERVREEHFKLREEEVKQYFPIDYVVKGLFSLANQIFGIDIAESSDSSISKWDPNVSYFDVLDSDSQEKLGGFYFDPFARPGEKAEGAWMGSVVERSKFFGRDGKGVRIPTGYIVCNQTRSVGDSPALMTIREIETLFHEFGHQIQHVLSRGEYSMISGTNGVEWDAVELPSQFMENWFYRKETLKRISKHVETGASLPDEIATQILRLRIFREGYYTSRQLDFASVDMELHEKVDPDNLTKEKLFAIEREFHRRFTEVEISENYRFLCSFAHIFAGEYSAGYYSYKWAEVLSADAFSAFQEVFDSKLEPEKQEEEVRKIGKRFRDTVLSLGGSQDPTKVFVAFRGREPSIDALMKQCGFK